MHNNHESINYSSMFGRHVIELLQKRVKKYFLYILTMNIVLQKNQFNIENVNLLKKKTNNVIAGYFTKFIYSSNLFTMNGLYLDFPIYNMVSNIGNKCLNISYQPYEKDNLCYLDYFTNIEGQILDYYNYVNNIRKQGVAILSKKLYSGNIKKILDNNIHPNNIITIKISGIWETDTEIGLAIKLIINIDF